MRQVLGLRFPHDAGAVSPICLCFRFLGTTLLDLGSRQRTVRHTAERIFGNSHISKIQREIELFQRLLESLGKTLRSDGASGQDDWDRPSGSLRDIHHLRHFSVDPLRNVLDELVVSKPGEMFIDLDRDPPGKRDSGVYNYPDKWKFGMEGGNWPPLSPQLHGLLGPGQSVRLGSAGE